MQYNNSSYQEGNRPVKRIFYMNFYQQLINSIDDLVFQYGHIVDGAYYLTFDDLDEDEQGELVSLALEKDDRDTYECFNQPEKEAKDDDITGALIKMLKINSVDNMEDFATTVRKQCLKRYHSYLNNLIEIRCEYLTETGKGLEA